MNRRLLPLLAFALLLPACGLRPIYGGGMTTGVGQSLHHIKVSPIDGKSGWLMVQTLENRFGIPDANATQYRLDIKLDDRIESFGVSSTNVVARERRTLRARYQLVEINSGRVLLDATAGSDAGIDVVQSEYATIAAEETTLERLSVDLADQITTHIALTIKQQPAAQ